MASITILDQNNQRCIWQRPQRHQHEPIALGPIETNWRNLVPYFKKPVEERGFVDPIGTLEDIEKFIARIESLNLLSQYPMAQQAKDAAIQRILAQQEHELSTEVDRFRANGIDAIQMSSSPDDDDTDFDAAAEHVGHVAQAIRVKRDDQYVNLSIDEAAPILRRIEWERYALACSNPIRVWLTEDGNALPESNRTPTDIVRDMGKKMKNAIEHDWAFGPTTNTPGIEQSMDELGIEDMFKPNTSTAGPSELGIHNFDDDDIEGGPTTRDGKPIHIDAVSFEPNEDEVERWAMDIPRIDAWLPM